MTSQAVAPPARLHKSKIQIKSVLWLRERFGWMGSHSGYDHLCQVMPSIQKSSHYITTERDPKKAPPQRYMRFLNWMARNVQASPFYGPASTAAEVATLWECLRQKPDVVHITYIENHLGILPDYKKRLSFNVVGTCHQPGSWWRLQHTHPESISSLDALIVLSRREINYFQQFLGDRVHFIPHGIDTDFFHPATQEKQLNPRFIFSGSWLRDLQTLVQVVEQTLKQSPSIQFDMIVPRSKRQNEYFYRLGRYPQVSWHAGISDEQLCQLYQQASGLVLPLIDCTANNALLEAISCGLPVITNDIGGIPDYTDPGFATLLPPGDVDGFVDAILELADSPAIRHNRGIAARQFAVNNLDWSQVVQQTFDLYQTVSHEDCLY
ncbi:MAG: glycosyltransferase [Leptolyngbya sp. SIO3F4]|nr:glycosyltransferase [Leptolyngbya sp. SIO3F4]